MLSSPASDLGRRVWMGTCAQISQRNRYQGRRRSRKLGTSEDHDPPASVFPRELMAIPDSREFDIH
jgi:hypothetical protein